MSYHKKMKSELSSKFVEWVAGFWEGDGLFEVKDGRIAATFGDVDNLDIHRYIYKVLGRGEYSDGFGPRLFGNDCLDFLTVVRGNLVSPKRVERLNRFVTWGLLKLPPFVVSLPTLDWLVGNWDANGSSGSGGYPVKISISSSDEALLAILKDTFGGTVNKSSSNFPRWRMFPSVAEMSRFLSIAKYLVENAKKEDKRLRLEGRLNTYLSVQEYERKELCLEK